LDPRESVTRITKTVVSPVRYVHYITDGNGLPFLAILSKTPKLCRAFQYGERLLNCMTVQRDAGAWGHHHFHDRIVMIRLILCGLPFTPDAEDIDGVALTSVNDLNVSWVDCVG
jgi:hypothetical protein